MKQLHFIIPLVIVLDCFFCSNIDSIETMDRTMPVSILLKTKPGVIPKNKLQHCPDQVLDVDLGQLLELYNVSEIKSVYRNRYNKHGRLKKELVNIKKKLQANWFQFNLDSRTDINNFISQLNESKSVIFALVEKPLELKRASIPNDSQYASQWHLYNNSNPNFDIDAQAAWNINDGRNDVIIAVLDGGIDYNHIDLDPGDRSRIIQGTDTGDGDDDPLDNLSANNTESYAGHGTNIAGVIGAITNNNQDVAGVMWNCKIMPVKMVRSGAIRVPFIDDWDWNTTAFPSDVADAMDYAVNHGADVINLSYGFASRGYTTNEVALRIPLLRDAMENAYQNNVVITAAMGNEYNDGNDVSYPAGFNDQVIAVGATTSNGTRSSFSNTGSHINLAAPGTNIRTTKRGGGTETVNGTSFSAPIVAGVAGLVISEAKDRSFNITNDDVRQVLERTAYDVLASGFDEETGYGIVNAYHALQLLDQPNQLYHYNSIGGSAVMTQNLSQWILVDGRWGLAAGTYLDVDQYKITKHVNFSVSFCSVPKVWMRERQSKSLSYGNPNSARPFSIISNVTKTGFDLEYVTYYVRYNISGQTINQWVPASPSSSNVAYTVVGEPNEAGQSVTISGPTVVCAQNTQYTLNNRSEGTTVTWSKSVGLDYVSGQNTDQYIVKANSSFIDGGWIKATLNSGCDDVSVTKNVSSDELPDIIGLNQVSTNSSSTVTFDYTNSQCSNQVISWSNSSNTYFLTTSTNYGVIQAQSWADDGETGYVYLSFQHGGGIYEEFTISSPSPPPPVVPNATYISIDHVPNDYPTAPYNSFMKVVASYSGNSNDVDYWEWQIYNSYVLDPDGSSQVIFLPTDGYSNTVLVKVRACNDNGCSDYVSREFNVY